MKKTAKTRRSLFEFLPAAVLTLTLLLTPFLAGRDETLGTAVVSILVAVAAFMLVWIKNIDRPIGFWPFVIFLALVACSTLVTTSMHASLLRILYFGGCVGAALVASSVFRKKEWFLVSIIGLAGVGLILGAMGVTEYVQHLRAYGSPDWRVFGPFFNPGFFGGYLVLALPVTLALLLSVKSPAAVLGSILAWAFELSALFLTGTRFAVISLAVAMVVFIALLLYRRCLNKSLLVRLALAVIVGAVAIHLTATPTMDRVRGKEAATQVHSTGFRVATWKGTAGIVKAHPLLGTGAGTFSIVFPRYTLAGPTLNAHDSYLQIASECGVPALAACAFAFLILFLAGVRGLKSPDEDCLGLLCNNGLIILTCGILAALIGGLARNLADSDIFNPGVGFTFFTLAGILAARGPESKPVNLKSSTKIVFSAIFVAMVVMWSLFAVAKTDADNARLAESNDPYAAMDLYRAATGVDPLCADYWLRLGQWETAAAQPHTTDWDAGIADIQRAIKLEPTRAKHQLVLGEILSHVGDSKAAVSAFKRAIELDPHATPAMLQIAQILGQSEATKAESESMYRKLLSIENTPFETLKGAPEMVNPDYAWGHYYFGKKYLAEKRWKDAAAEFKAAVDRLELRKSFKFQLQALTEIGQLDPEEQKALDQLLSDSKAGLEEANRH